VSTSHDISMIAIVANLQADDDLSRVTLRMMPRRQLYSNISVPSAFHSCKRMFFLVRTAAILSLAFASAMAEPINVSGEGIRGAAQPQVAVGTNGTVHLVFGSGNAIFHVSSKDGRSFGTPVKIAELEKLALGKRRGPRLAVTDNVIAVTAISHSTGTLHGWTSSDQGKTWTATEPLNTVAKSAREGLHGMASDRRGLTAVAWLDLRNGKTELWSRVSKDGGRSWAPEVLAYASPDGTICQCCHTSVAIGPRGEIAALWRNALGGARDMWMAVSTDGGQTFPNPQKLGTGTWKLEGCPMDGGSIAFDDAGEALTVWRRESTVFSAAPGKPETKLADSSAQPVAVVSGGQPVIAFEKSGNVMVAVGTQPPRSIGKGQAPAVAAGPKAAYLAWVTPAGVSLEILQ
jgi:hypothetical protein